jgi:phenylalanyl-tRNA synthetase beta subunit
LLQSVEVFDLFEGGPHLPPGVRSLGYRMVYQDPATTLTEEALLALQSKIIEAVKGLGIAMR